MEKILIHTDLKGIETDFNQLGNLNEALLNLKMEFDNLPLSLNKKAFDKLMTEGAESIVKDYFDELTKKTKLPDRVLSIVLDPHTLNEYKRPLEARKNQIIMFLGFLELDSTAITWGDLPEVKHEAVRDHIEERNKRYAETPEEIELLKLVQNFCEAANTLEAFILENGNPPTFTGQNFYEVWLYITEEAGKLIVNPDVFYHLRQIRAKNQKAIANNN